MTYEIEVGDYMLDDAVNDATRIWRDILEAFGHAQGGQETIVRLGTVPIARIIPVPWVTAPAPSFDATLPVLVREEPRPRGRWRLW